MVEEAFKDEKMKLEKIIDEMREKVNREKETIEIARLKEIEELKRTIYTMQTKRTQNAHSQTEPVNLRDYSGSPYLGHLADALTGTTPIFSDMSSSSSDRAASARLSARPVSSRRTSPRRSSVDSSASGGSHVNALDGAIDGEQQSASDHSKLSAGPKDRRDTQNSSVTSKSSAAGSFIAPKPIVERPEKPSEKKGTAPKRVKELLVKPKDRRRQPSPKGKKKPAGRQRIVGAAQIDLSEPPADLLTPSKVSPTSPHLHHCTCAHQKLSRTSQHMRMAVFY